MQEYLIGKSGTSRSGKNIFFVLYLTRPHVCRHTYCTNMANSGMNPKTLQYLMGHSDISVTLNIYTHTGYDDAKKELSRLKEARDELEKKKFVTQKHAQITHVSLIS